MSRKRLTIEIAGSLTGISNSQRAPKEWVTTWLSVLAEVPSGPSMSVDIETGNSDNGGLSFRCADLSTLLNDLAVIATTTLDGDLSASATSVDVLDASALSASGRIWVGGECIVYSGKSTNTLTGCTRGALGTDAAPHDDASDVFASNPTIFGRRCVVRWYDDTDTSYTSGWTRFVGIIDGVSWADGFYVLNVLSPAQLVLDQKLFSGAAFVRGKLGAKLSTGSDMEIDADNLATLKAAIDTRGYAHLRVADEIVEIRHLLYPRRTAEIDSYTAPSTLTTDYPEAWRVGQRVDLTDSAGVVKAESATITAITSTTITASGIPSTYSHAAGDLIAANYTGGVRAGRVKRGVFDTLAVDIEAGEDFTELRVMEGDALTDILFPALCSRSGDGSFGLASGAYDILPSGWGLALPSRYFDLGGLLEIARSGRSGWRRYLFSEGVAVADLISWLALSSGSAIFFNEAGQLTAKLWGDLFPLDAGAQTISAGFATRPPQITAGTAQIRNRLEVRCDFDPIDDDSTHTIFADVAESIPRYGQRVWTIEDPGLRSDASLSVIQGVLSGILLARSLPYPMVSVPVRLVDGIDWRPGDVVQVSLEHAPNIAGGRGVAGFFRITSVQPNDAQGEIDLSLWYMGSAARLGYIAPSAIVTAVVGTKVSVQTGATSRFAPQDLADSAVLHDGAGTDDVDWFAVGDLVEFHDASALGTVATAEIVSINYGSNFFDVDVVPGWLAAGDFVRLAPYDDWTAAPPSTDEQRRGVFLALAEGTPPTIDGEDPYFWGL